MTLNASGPISLAGTTSGQSIEVELGSSGTAQLNLNSTAVRSLLGVPSGAISLSNAYGKTYAFAWSNITTSSSMNFSCIAASPTIWVALADSQSYSYSYDGVTWSTGTMPTVGTVYWGSIAYGNGLFVAACFDTAYGYAAYSSDGINWTVGNPPAGGDWIMGYGNGLFIAIDSTTTGYSTPDGHTWTSFSVPVALYWTSVGYGNGMYIAVAGSSSTASYVYSSNGNTWSTGTFPSSTYWGSVAYGNGVWVVTPWSNSTTALYSSNGITWSTSTIPGAALPSTNPTGWLVTFGYNKFVIMSRVSSSTSGAGVTSYSFNGSTWHTTSFSYTVTGPQLASNGTKFAIVNYGVNYGYLGI